MNVMPTFFGALMRRKEYDVDPVSGVYYKYEYYRTVIAEDCQCRCVYCDSHEDRIGGREAMQIDHFRPWNKAFGEEKERKFAHLKNHPENLLHSCAVCNRFKSARWPTNNPDLPHDDAVGWIDPFLEPRSNFLVVEKDGTVLPCKLLGKYLISTLRLNRPLLKRQRELQQLLDKINVDHGDKFRATIKNEPNSEHARTAKFALELLDLMRKEYCLI